MIITLKISQICQCYLVMVQAGRDPGRGLARSEGRPLFRSYVITLLILDRLLSCFRSKFKKKVVALSLLQGRGRTQNDPSSSLSSLLINSSTRHSFHFSLSFELVVDSFSSATFRDLSFYMGETMHTVDTMYIACVGVVYSLLCKHPLPSSGGSDAADRHISLRIYQSLSALRYLKHYCSKS